MTSAQIALPEKLIDVFHGSADVRGAYGGRGSGKTRSFAKMAAVEGYRHGMAGTKGMILCARQFMNSLDDSSLEECKRAIEEEPFLAAYYELGDKYIKSKDGRIWFAFAGLDRNISSIKSKGRILLCWVDEAETVTEQAWEVLIPTLREEGEGWNAELWVTWNPARKGSATDKRFRQTGDARQKVVQLNWRDNPKFPAVLERQRLRDQEQRPDSYEHIWEGAYATAVEGAYFAKLIADARRAGRVGRVAADPLMAHRVFVDIGGTGARSDAFSMWVAQFVGREIRVVDYYEAVGQPMATHAAWLRERGYERAGIWLPHDGAQHDKVQRITYETAFRGAGWSVTVVPNQGPGSAKQRIEASRRILPMCWFDEARCSGGLEALGWYHEKRDAERNIGLGPEHDWSSHAADAFGLMAICYTPPQQHKLPPLQYDNRGIV